MRTRGLAHFARRDLAGARTDLDAAVVADPADAVAWNGRAIVALQTGDIDAAIDDFSTALRLRPGFAAALANRGNAWLAKGDAARALDDLDAALALSPARPELALTLRGRARLAQGDASAALADFDAALAGNPSYSNALDGRGHALFVLGRLAESAQAFEREWRQRPDPESATAWIIAARRAGQPASIPLAALAGPAQAREGLPAGVALYAGRLAASQVLQAATAPDARVQRERQCTAQFTVGEWYLANGKAEQARAHLQAAASACGAWQAEAADARAELARR